MLGFSDPKGTDDGAGEGARTPEDTDCAGESLDADEHGVNKLSGEKCCLLKLAAAGAPPRGAPGPYIWPPERFEAKFPKCVEEGVTEPYGESILTIPEGLGAGLCNGGLKLGALEVSD